MGVLTAAMAVLLVGGAVWLVRYVRWNRRRIDRLENQLAEIGEAERIIARAHGHRDRSHLKLLGLIPLGWLVGSRARLAVATAASAAVVGVGFTATDTPIPREPSTPPAGAEPSEDNPAVVDRPASDVPPTSLPATTTTSVAASPPAIATDRTGSTSTPTATPLTTSAPSTTTTTTLPVEVTAELPRVCLNPVPIDLHLCTAN